MASAPITNIISNKYIFISRDLCNIRQ